MRVTPCGLQLIAHPKHTTHNPMYSDLISYFIFFHICSPIQCSNINNNQPKQWDFIVLFFLPYWHSMGWTPRVVTMNKSIIHIKIIHLLNIKCWFTVYLSDYQEQYLNQTNLTFYRIKRPLQICNTIQTCYM